MTLLVAMKASGAVLGMNYAANVGASWVYNQLCVPQSIWDIPQSIVATASPVCSFMISTIQLTQTNFATVLSTTVTAALIGLMRE